MPNQEKLHPREDDRLRALQELQVLDTPIEERFDRITRLAAKVFDVPVCAISCIDQHRQWFKSIHGSSCVQTARGISFCQHTILENESLVVNDAFEDERFSDSPLVTDKNGVRFYAGVPIKSREGLPIAAFCLNGFEPRDFDPRELEILKEFARVAQSLLQMPKSNQAEHQIVSSVGASWRVSLIDPLTRLWNIEGIMSVLDEMQRTNSTPSVQSDSGIKLTMIDLKGFARVNKALGHVGGDETLRRFTSDLLREHDDCDTIGRLRGNTFLLLQSGSLDPHLVSKSLQWVQSIADEFMIEDDSGSYGLGANVSSVTVPHHWQGNSEQLMSSLDHGMHLLKSGQRTQPVIIDAVTGHERTDHTRDRSAA